jgi:hypothetical protein
MVIGSRAARFGGASNRRQQIFEDLEHLGGRTIGQPFEDRKGKTVLLTPDLFGGVESSRSEGYPLRTPVAGVRLPEYETPLLQASQVSGQRAGRDSKPSPEIAQPQTATTEGLEGRGLRDGHPTAADVRPFGEGKPPDKCPDALSEPDRLGVVDLRHVKSPHSDNSCMLQIYVCQVFSSGLGEEQNSIPQIVQSKRISVKAEAFETNTNRFGGSAVTFEP